MGSLCDPKISHELQPRSARLLITASIASTHRFLRESDSTIRYSGQIVTIGPGRDGGLSWRTGFLTAFKLPRSLPKPFALWEETVQRLPTFLRNGRVRKAIHTLPCLATEVKAVPDQYLSRASIVVSTLLHAYAFEARHREDEKSSARLVLDLITAWQSVSSRLGRPVLHRTPADDILNNVLLSGYPSRLSIEYFNLPEERMTAGVQVEMEHTFAPVLESMVNIQKHIIIEEDSEITKELCEITRVIIDCGRVFLSTRCRNTKDGLDFVIWGKTYPEIGRALYTGGLNNSGVNSPLFHALDTFIGIEDIDHELYQQQVQRRSLLPLPVQLFIEALGDRKYSIRSYANKHKHSTVAAAFNALIQTYSWLLELHRMRAVGGIAMVEASGRQQTAGGIRSGDQSTLDEKINRQLTRSILSRIGCQPQTLPATVVSVSQSGNSCLLTLQYAFALPVRSGDRIQIWPNAQLAIDQYSSTSLLPRCYTVSDAETCGPRQRVSLTVAHSGGLCSTFLQSREPGQEIQTRLAPAPDFWSLDDSDLPLLLIAQGVGLGPFLGFLRNRHKVQEGGSRGGKIMLIIGAKDIENIPYFSEVISLTQVLPLEVHCALSQTKNQPVKYSKQIQCFGAVRTHDIIPNFRENIRSDILEKGGHVFICGSVSFGTTIRSTLHALDLLDSNRYHEDCFGGHAISKANVRAITISELIFHNKPHDLWLSIEGVVFDLTGFSSIHPGGLKTLIEFAGMPADRKFLQIHNGDTRQGVLAQMEQYKIGCLELDARLSSYRMHMVLRVVQMQNVLTNSTFFAPERNVPFYVFADSLTLIWGNIWQLYSIFREQTLSILTQELNGALKIFKEHSWRYLGKRLRLTLEERELRLLVAYSSVWECFHSFFDHAKVCCLQYYNNSPRFVEELDAILQDCFSRVQNSVRYAMESLESDIESYKADGVAN